MNPLVLETSPKTSTPSVQDGESTMIESVYDDDSYIEEIVESDEEIIEEVVEDSDEETGTFDDQSTLPYGGNDSSSVAFDDDSSIALPSLDSDAPMYNKNGGGSNKGRSSYVSSIQNEMNQSAVFEGTRKAMEEELEREKARERQAGLEALRQRRREQEAERPAELREEDASHIEETEEQRRKRQGAPLLKQKEQDEDAHRRLAEEIKRVDVALSKKRDTLVYSKLQGPADMEKRKKALAELRRQAARQELARNNEALKATRASRSGASVASQTSAVSFRPKSIPNQKGDTPSPTGNNPGYVEQASVPENVDSVDIYLRTPAPVSPLQLGGALTPATASKLEFGNVTSPYPITEIPRYESETIQEESVPQSLMPKKEKEDETSIEAPEATAKNVEAEPAINTEDVGNMTDQAFSIEKKAVDETEELPSEQEANRMANAAQDDGSTGNSNTGRQPGLQNGMSDSASKHVPPKSTSSVSPKAAEQASKSASEENTVRGLSPTAPSDTQRAPMTTPKKRFSAPKTTDTSVIPTASQVSVKPLTKSDTPNPPSPNDVMPSDWDGKYHTIDDLRQGNIPGLDNTRREHYLSPEDFQEYFKLTKEEFVKFPKWKRDKAKRSLDLF
jgi:hypothetical protein